MDTSSITGVLDTVQTTVTAVGAIVAGAIGFFLIAKVVKWVRK